MKKIIISTILLIATTLVLLSTGIWQLVEHNWLNGGLLLGFGILSAPISAISIISTILSLSIGMI